jgi:hypothetical protein
MCRRSIVPSFGRELEAFALGPDAHRYFEIRAAVGHRRRAGLGIYFLMKSPLLRGIGKTRRAHVLAVPKANMPEPELATVEDLALPPRLGETQYGAVRRAQRDPTVTGRVKPAT